MLAYDVTKNPLNNNEWAFPLAECIHILGFTLSIGTIAIVDLSLLGLGFRRQDAAQLAKAMAPWTLVGLAIMVTSGPVIFSSDPLMYLYNQSFRFKIAALLVAILFNYTIHRKVALSDHPSPAMSVVVGGLSLALWVSVVAAGLFIAFV
jgi:uncharacterized membrane protein